MRQRNRVDDEAAAQAMTELRDAADAVCGKRLKPLIPVLVDAMERHGHPNLDPVIKTKFLRVSAATIHRVLALRGLILTGSTSSTGGARACAR